MSFQAYVDTIKDKTGKGPEDFQKMADEKGLSERGRLKPGVKAGQIIEMARRRFRPWTWSFDGDLCSPYRQEEAW